MTLRGRRRTPVADTCRVCKKPVTQPLNGRPRILCGRPSCARTRRNLRRAHRKWSPADRLEAYAVWEYRCAVCLDPTLLLGLRRGFPLPVCWECRNRPLTSLARQWLKRIKPGCPLPDPYRMAG